jgi:hypothetical protein
MRHEAVCDDLDDDGTTPLIQRDPADVVADAGAGTARAMTPPASVDGDDVRQDADDVVIARALRATLVHVCTARGSLKSC